MYRVLIADDEVIMVKSLHKFLKENYSQLKIVAEVQNGAQLIEAALTQAPDIVLLDIRMPGINGLEAIAELKKCMPNVVYVIISAHDEFAYIQQAMAMGVQYYILKPLKKEDIKLTLNKIIYDIDRMKEKTLKEAKMKERLAKMQPVIQNEWVYSLAMGDMEKIKYMDYAGLLGVNIDAGYCMVVEISVEDLKIFGDDIRADHLEVVDDIRFFFSSKRYHCIVGKTSTEQITVFVGQERRSEDNLMHIIAIKLATELVKSIFTTKGIRVRIGIGRFYTTQSDFMLSYHEALTALASDESKVVHIDLLNKKGTDKVEYPFPLERLIFEKIRVGDTEKAVQLHRQFIAEILKNTEANLEASKQFLFENLSYLGRCLLEGDQDVEKMQDYLHHIRKIFHVAHVSELYVFCKNTIQSLSEEFRMLRQSNANLIIEKAIEYINIHYKEDINLNSVAQYVLLSPTYFSRLFKKLCGKNFIDYLTEVRINASKNLFHLHPNKSIKEAYFQVGYNDPKYFSKVFKKETGMSPESYKAAQGELNEDGKSTTKD